MCSYEWIALFTTFWMHIIYFYDNNFHALRHFIFLVCLHFLRHRWINFNLFFWGLLKKHFIMAIKEFLRNKLTFLRLYIFNLLKLHQKFIMKTIQIIQKMRHCYRSKVTCELLIWCIIWTGALIETEKRNRWLLLLMSVAWY